MLRLRRKHSAGSLVSKAAALYSNGKRVFLNRLGSEKTDRGRKQLGRAGSVGTSESLADTSKERYLGGGIARGHSQVIDDSRS